ncbi:MAG: DUF1801 domain-containing protein [Azoarcus sp.]|nr:DUF1801 domain-containing protein [Azoarcus sp.]
MLANSLSPCINTTKVEESRDFYVKHFGAKITFDCGWYVNLEFGKGTSLQFMEKPFCSIFSYAKHVSLEFGAGASLTDKFTVLEGEGKLRRHIKLSSVEDIAGKHVGEYLLLALKAPPKP